MILSMSYIFTFCLTGHNGQSGQSQTAEMSVVKNEIQVIIIWKGQIRFVYTKTPIGVLLSCMHNTFNRSIIIRQDDIGWNVRPSWSVRLVHNYFTKYAIASQTTVVHLEKEELILITCAGLSVNKFRTHSGADHRHFWSWF